jgi:hypothetical protein
MKKNQYKIVTKKICELTEQEFIQLHRLTFKPSGGSALTNLLLEAKINLGIGERPAWPVCYALHNDSIIGWTVASRVITLSRHKPFVQIGVYVSVKHRRNGLARKLVGRLIRNINVDVFAYPHDAKSVTLFKNLGFTKINKNKPDIISTWRHSK